MHLQLKDKKDCEFDMLALGEVMLRLDPGDTRIKTARSFRVWEGGGEYNVARGLRRCFGLKTGVVTAFADNEIGRLCEDFILQGGVDTSLIRWVPYDGIGRTVRNGLNFTERGFGIRGAVGVSDRGNTAISQLKPGDIDWDEIFGALADIHYTGRIVSEPFVMMGGEVGRDIKVWRDLVDDPSEKGIDAEAAFLLNFTFHTMI